MTAKEFEKTRLTIEKERFFCESSDPITYGIERAVFEQHKLHRLIEAARQVDGKLARIKMEKWVRMLDRARRSQERLEMRREELRANRPPLFAGYKIARSVEVA